ncbi:hypothetical protein NDU88_002869 [Pleurodeles waltl]|uniref:t-SNARE coiled-coil homology domain-containing protein n=1 Tax=Pleurodeles waltl TaxID=8319 RepID=A0AAV7Q7C1_PLEWA|nr:hypothetical protein NDU88_002869 [Pleurodeles waltl]
MLRDQPLPILIPGNPGHATITVVALLLIADCPVQQHCSLAFSPPTAIMGKHEACQSKLNFEGTHPTQHWTSPERPEEEEHQDINLKELLIHVKTSLKAIHAQLGNLTDRLDQRVDKHGKRLDILENRVSDVNDAQAESKEHLL